MTVPFVVHVVAVEGDSSHTPEPEPFKLLRPEGSQQKTLRAEAKNNPLDKGNLVRHGHDPDRCQKLFELANCKHLPRFVWGVLRAFLQ